MQQTSKKLGSPASYGLRSDYKDYVLPFTHIADEILLAEESIEQERSGEQLGLYCRWNSLNKAMLKYWRFNQVNLLAGSSGAGKSYILNMLINDFTDTISTKEIIGKGKTPTIPAHKALNADFAGKIIVLHFGYEMYPADELIRTVSGQMNQSYSYLLSSKWDDEGKKYNKITDKEVDEIKRNLDGLKHKPIYYVKRSGTLSQMYITAYELLNKFPDCRLVLSNDHTLLIKKGEKEKSEIELIANAASTFIKIRQDFEAMIVAIGQLNGDIQKVERKSNRALHYPVYTDIHGSNQMYMATDNCVVFNRPELLNIPLYGEHGLTSEHLIHGAILKSRRGTVGNAWFKEDLAHGRIHEAVMEDFIHKEIDFT